jgi:phage/plasmid-like protein (TIGR03299 family)
MSNNTNTFEAFLNNIEINGARSVETLQQIGLDWTVDKVQLCLPDGTPVNHYANQRSDNKEVLHVVSEGYLVLQNEELVELCETVAKTFDYKVHKGGALNGGRKVYVQLETDSVHGIGENNDTVNRYITAVNSFDGSTAVAFGSLGFTISCQNTFFAAARHANMTRIKHTSNMRERIESAMRQVEYVRAEEETLYSKFFNMASVQATPEHIRQVVQKTTDVDIFASIASNKDMHSTRKLNIAESLLASIQRETSYKGMTLWGLMSGVTHYTSHIQSAPKRENGRIESKLTGQAQNMDAVAFDYLEKVLR